MGRKPSPIWTHFTKCSKAAYKIDRASFNHCNATVLAKPNNLKTHLNNCLLLPQTIGALLAQLNTQNNHSQTRVSDSQKDTFRLSGSSNIKVCNSQKGPLSKLKIETLTPQRHTFLNTLLAKAVHYTGLLFHTFDHPSWHMFCAAVRPTWHPPCPKKVGNELLQCEYENMMCFVIERIRNDKGGILAIDGATNVISKSMSNVVLHTLLPFFVEHLGSDLHKVTSEILFMKLKGLVFRLDKLMGSSSCYGFLSDSCNSMRKLCDLCLRNKLFKFAYGCSTHALHNLSEDLEKATIFADTIRQALFLSKTIKGNGLLRKVYDKVCMERLYKTYAMVLYLKSRWSTVNLMLKRLLLVPVITYMPYVVMHEKERLGLDQSFELPAPINDIITNSCLWERVSKGYTTMDPICKCIGILEGEATPISLVYATFLYTRIVLRRLSHSEDNPTRDERVLYQWNRIYSPILPLSFYCDPYFVEMRRSVIQEYGEDFAGMGNGNIVEQCHQALSIFAEDSQHNERLVNNFMLHCVSPHNLLPSLRKWHPRLVWGQLKDSLPDLANVMMKVYKAPSSSASVERNLKIAKRIFTSRRGRTGELKIEKQVAIAHNFAVLCKQTPQTRGDGFEKHISEIVSNSLSSGTSDVANGIASHGLEAEIEEESLVGNEEEEQFLESLLDHVLGIEEIADTILFNDPDWL